MIGTAPLNPTHETKCLAFNEMFLNGSKHKNTLIGRPRIIITGIESSRPQGSGKSLFDVIDIKTETNELELEQKETSKNKKETEAEELEDGLAKAETLVEPASVDDIMSMFNAVQVEV